ncbi:protein translocase subunit SecD [Longimycelium tulufanense]|uniref:Protein translocase subunit SecD n=1 Tax=Longimycelium tulufanense TaxID=907463 RepID=A0A8J3FWI9_9PSEU|nr:protein translocase subunit SecD [Longimycelium tulufanense]GGM72312.1 protein translocase subunit SecD [Longimycelium tulufanense]
MAPPAGQIRPGRYLAVFALIVVVLYALVFFTGDRQATPKLGIDLQGGTRVTLTARSPDGKPPSQEALNQAKSIIDTRVNGMGISGAEVVLDGNNLVITVPGEGGEQAKLVSQTAEVNFRKVVAAVPATPPAPGDQNGANNSGQPGGDKPNGGQPGNANSGDQPNSGGQPDGKPKPQGRPAPAAEQQPPNNGDKGSVDEKTAEEIRKAKETRQSTDPQVQQQALAALDCSKPDPLRGNDEADKPLVTCSKDKTEKYVLDKVFLPGKEVSSANAVQDPRGAGFIVELDFKSEGAKIWGDFTSKNVNERAAFVLDTEVVSAPTINEPILGGRTQISGQFTQKSASDLAQILQYGALPLSFDSSQAETVSATLGLASLEAGLIAGLVGFALIAVYSLIYYRGLGILLIASLGLTAGLVYPVLVLLGRWIGFTLDLAGVAGFIIAIGVTADSFVVFFERIKDEIREGRTVRSAVQRAWPRARRTILSADGVVFLAVAVLYALAVGQVRGFAFTLGLSTVLDLLIVFLVTHPMVVLASRSKFLTRPGLSGLGAMQRLGAAQRKAAAAAASANTKEA